MDVGGRPVEPVGCPGELLPYPTEIGTVEGVAGGFLCFPAFTARGALVVTLGSTTVEVAYEPAFVGSGWAPEGWRQARC